MRTLMMTMKASNEKAKPPNNAKRLSRQPIKPQIYMKMNSSLEHICQDICLRILATKKPVFVKIEIADACRALQKLAKIKQVFAKFGIAVTLAVNAYSYDDCQGFKRKSQTSQ